MLYFNKIKQKYHLQFYKMCFWKEYLMILTRLLRQKIHKIHKTD
ncbi:hypothetical protein AAJ76_940002043 [Vairimorpha ceranae]|uniref:Uncharacterized protein n=1 Tax=Vairimorpha ceranae TaxID=40302 RepID=A0A0F9YNE1_9MICR|nr:hypothetical protein AAJ76_940002043 [Vairimorpha ceranae]KKO74247.1 hypothetical protein AAJ76_940002043 [Vairimorpha ceranae]